MKLTTADKNMLKTLQRQAFQYFLDMLQPETGLVADNTHNEPEKANVTAVGFGLAAYIVGVERGFITRAEAIGYVLTILRFFRDAPQGEAPDATGYKGFYYRFLDVKTGQRADNSEISTVDTAYLLAGMLAAAVYFDRDTEDESEIRTLAEKLYSRVDWQWALNYGTTISHGWTPEKGFLEERWENYNEGMLIYLLALGSPECPIKRENYDAWVASYEWKAIYHYKLLDSDPLFVHQFPHIWVDFRGMQDDFMREKQSDYFENSRRATYAQQRYAMCNPRGFEGYGEYCWGFTATDGPGDILRPVDGVMREFHGYKPRAVPDGPDDGTISPCAALVSLPFAPEIVIPTVQYIRDTYPEVTSEYGFKCSLNPTFRLAAREAHESESDWITSCHYALDQGPVVLMIENYLTGFFWDLMHRCSPLVQGLQLAGFTGGWLDDIEG